MLTGQRGQTATELLGVLLVVSAIIAVIAASGFARDLRHETARQICLFANESVNCPPPLAQLERRERARDRRAARRDSDHDGVPDRLERRYGTNPRLRDSDRDGIRDGAELRRGIGRAGARATRSPFAGDPFAFAAGSAARALHARRHGTLPGRRIDTSNYQRDIYKRLYEGKKPLKYQFKIPNLQGRRGGKLRVGLFINECKPAGLGEGDCRGFDSEFHSARTRVTFVFDFKSDVLTVLINPSCSTEPVRGGCSGPLTPKLGPRDDGTFGDEFGSGMLKSSPDRADWAIAPISGSRTR